MASREDASACWRWWFELAPPPGNIPESADHRRLASLLMSPAGHESDFAELADKLADSGDTRAGAAAIGGGIAAICDAGRQFAPLRQWIDKADAMIGQASPPEPLAKASLLLHTIIAELLGPTHIPNLRQRLAHLAEAVEQADSDPLRIAHAAAAGYIEAIGGRLHGAGETIADALHLSPEPNSALLPKVHLHSSQALVNSLQGNATAAGNHLEGLLSHPLFDTLPLSLWLLCLSHRLFALALGGESPTVDVMAERIRSRIIPEHNAHLQSYLHYSLGVAALLDGKPSQALDHGRRSMQLGKQCACVTGEAVPALLVGQALLDLEQNTKAQQHLSHWLVKWQSAGFDLLYTAGLLELAHLLSRSGNVGDARQTLMLARSILPEEEPLPTYHRPRAFGERLSQDLLPEASPPLHGSERPTPVTISTLGGLVVRIGHETIYDRDWRGDRTKALLKALIVLGGHKVSSEQLCDLLWPDSEGIQARQNLKITTWRLRRLGISRSQAPLPWLAMQRGQYSLVHALCNVDIFEFDQCLQKARESSKDTALLTAALDLYTGDFLPRDDSQTWIIAHREQLRHRYLTTVHTLARRSLASQRYDIAMPYLERAVEIEPTDERSSEFLIRFLLAQGYPGEALRVYRHLVAALFDCLGITPGYAVTDLVSPLLSRGAAQQARHV